jgi:hypothetical protein
MNNKNSNIIVYLGLGVAAIFFVSCLLSSCGKTTVLPAASNINYQVINLSPDVLPVNLYIDNTRKNGTTSFYYPNPSGYFALTSVDVPFQIRSASILLSSANILSIDTLLKNNVNYTLFITGLKANVRPQDSISYILTRDTSSAPTVGRSKLRFVNSSVGSTGIDITANGTLAFTNQPYKMVSKYIEIPAGNYDFKAYPTGVPSTILTDMPGITVQDGKVYTLYCKGIVARTDSAAFGLAIFNNLSSSTIGR